ncbi:MAG: hypothetical protein HOW97_31315, partial [Catenulispora sp.]|nr:hypothetical protein [Catenulispora sp.]
MHVADLGEQNTEAAQRAPRPRSRRTPGRRGRTARRRRGGGTGIAAGSSRAADRRADVLLALAASILSALVFLACHRALIDDSYITLGFVRDVALRGHWGLISSRVSNTATSPLNVLVLAAITLVVRNPVVATGVAQVTAAGGTAVLLGRALAARGLPRWPA